MNESRETRFLDVHPGVTRRSTAGRCRVRRADAAREDDPSERAKHRVGARRERTDDARGGRDRGEHGAVAAPALAVPRPARGVWFPGRERRRARGDDVQHPAGSKPLGVAVETYAREQTRDAGGNRPAEGAPGRAVRRANASLPPSIRASRFSVKEICTVARSSAPPLTRVPSSIRYNAGESKDEPAWKDMFRFWMNPKPNSLEWAEKARGEGAWIRGPDEPGPCVSSSVGVPSRARSSRRLDASSNCHCPSTDLESSRGKFAARYLHRCTAIGVRRRPRAAFISHPLTVPRSRASVISFYAPGVRRAASRVFSMLRR